tara:strand:+ start:4088 stop:5032 length:945 start_codon:yes stop_codon:yes gene_type:complete
MAFNLLNKIVLLIIIVLQTQLSYAMSGLLFDSITGPRPTSFANSYSAVANDAYAIYENPAGLATIKTKLLQFSSYKKLEATNSSIEYTQHIRNITLALGLKNIQLKGFEESIMKNDTIIHTGNSFGYMGTLLTVGLGSKLLNTNFYYGVSGSKIMHQLHDESSTGGLSCDVGFLFKQPSYSFSFGIKRLFSSSIKWNTGSQEILSRTVYVGLSKQLNKILLTSQFDYNSNINSILKIGTEYNVLNMIYIRSGISTSVNSYTIFSNLFIDSLTAHAGVGLDLGKVDLNYSYSSVSKNNSNYLDSVYKFSVSIDFN